MSIPATAGDDRVLECPPTRGRPGPLPGWRGLPVLIALMGMVMCGSQPAQPSNTSPDRVPYRDPRGRFEFSFPAEFGAASPGTNDGAGDRVAAIRFSAFSAAGIGGEAVVTRGAPSLDVQAGGGLYDSIASEALSAALLAIVRQHLPQLTRETLCGQIAREQHLDADAAPFASLTDEQRRALVALDRLGNVAPAVQRCTQSGDTVTFEKQAAVVDGGPRRSVYGSVRFLSGDYSTFQIIRAGRAATPSSLVDMQAVVDSFRQR